MEEEAEGSLQLQWWNSETKSNWMDGYIKHAYLLKDEQAISRVVDYVEKVLKTQE